MRRSSARQLEKPVCSEDNNEAGNEREIRQVAGLAIFHIVSSQIEIIEHMLREPALVLEVVPEPEHGDDQRCCEKPCPQCHRVPDLGTCAHEHGVDERKDRSERQQPGRRAPRTLDVAAVNAVDPAGIEVQEVEDDVADIRNGEDEEEARRVGAGNRTEVPC